MDGTVRSALLGFAVAVLAALPAAAGEKVTVYTVSYPLQYFTERIGGDAVEVVFPAPADVDPAYWMPDADTVAAYQRADLIILNGANYAKWTGKVTLPRGKMVNTSSKFRDEYITSDEETTHSHGPGGEHAHENLAFTTWLDLDLASRQAERIAAALSRKLPERKADFRKNFEELRKDLREVDEELKVIMSKKPDTPLVGSHPVYDYLARRYGLNLKSVHWEPGEIPSQEQWNDLKHILEGHPARWW